MAPRRLRLATRGSPLARWQAEHVASLLRRAHPQLDVGLEVVDTLGDRRQDRPVWEMAGQGVFVKEVQAAVLDGRADAAVHSAKDLPAADDSTGLVIVAIPPRADPRDALVGSTLEQLQPGAPVATGSVRRRAQLAALRPDLTFTSLRGNIATRLSRLPSGGALLMAAAALDRLGIRPPVVQILEPEVMLPQVGQGAIAVECVPSSAAAELVAVIDDPGSARCVRAERAFLGHLGGGCDLPVAAHARLDPAGLVVEGLLASLDGRVVLRASAASGGPGAGPEAAAGTTVAEELLAAGGRELLS